MNKYRTLFYYFANTEFHKHRRPKGPGGMGLCAHQWTSGRVEFGCKLVMKVIGSREATPPFPLSRSPAGCNSEELHHQLAGRKFSALTTYLRRLNRGLHTHCLHCTPAESAFVILSIFTFTLHSGDRSSFNGVLLNPATSATNISHSMLGCRC